MNSFADRTALEELVAEIPEPKELVLIEGTGHFFEGHLDEMRETVERWVRATVLAASEQH